MNYRILYTIFLYFACLGLYSQSLTDNIEKYKILDKGIKRVEVSFNDFLKEIWLIDKTNYTIEIHLIQPSLVDPIAPKFDSIYSTYNLEKIFFNKKGNVDSVLIINYGLLLNIKKPIKMDTVIDTTIVKYNYDIIDGWLMNAQTFHKRNGILQKGNTNYYGYNQKMELILLITDEGRVQSYYSYNKKGKIVKEKIFNTIINYKYDYHERLIKRTTEGLTIYYEYYDNSLLKKMTLKGKNKGVWTYKYE